MTGSDHSDKEFRETRNLYVSMMSLYELADKLFGATYVAFMRAQDLSIAQIFKFVQYSTDFAGCI